MTTDATLVFGTGRVSGHLVVEAVTEIGRSDLTSLLHSIHKNQVQVV